MALSSTLLGAGRLADQLRVLLRRRFDGWRLHDLPAAQTPLQEAKPVLGPRVLAMLDRYGFATVEQVAAVPELELLDVRHFGPKARLAVDAALAAHRSVDDPAVVATQERRRAHIRRQLGAVHQARNAAFLALLAASDLPPADLVTIVGSLGEETVPPADPAVLQLLHYAGRPDLSAVYARTHTSP